jgi:hypothetical protein
MVGLRGVLRFVLPTHIEDIQLSFAVKTRCIISGPSRAGERQMGLDKPGQAHVGGTRLTALSVEAVVLLLKRSGAKQASVEAVRADLAAGAPQNADGTINLITYGAWLVSDLARREGGHAG